MGDHKGDLRCSRQAGTLRLDMSCLTLLVLAGRASLREQKRSLGSLLLPLDRPHGVGVGGG